MCANQAALTAPRVAKLPFAASITKLFELRLAAKGFLALLLLASRATALRAQNIQIMLLNGNTGRPVAGACVGVWMMNDARTGVFIPTDKNGVARLRLTQKDNEVNVSYNPFHSELCQLS
jgi:hypothetical protein